MKPAICRSSSGDLLAEHPDHGFDGLRDLGLTCAVAMQLFGFAHVDQLSATTQEIGQARTSRAERDGSGQVQRCAHLRQDTGVDAVGLGQRAGGSGKLACLTRIDAREGMATCRQRGDQVAVAAAGGLEDEADVVVERIEPGGDGIRCIGDLPDPT